MKKLVLLLFATTFCFTGWATKFEVLKVNRTGKLTTVEIVMTDELKVSFDGGNLIATGSGAEVKIPTNNITSIVHDSKNSIEGVIADADFEFNNGLIFHNLPHASQIVICDLAGKVEFSTVAEGELTIPIDGLATGTHILSVNGNALKIHIK